MAIRYRSAAFRQTGRCASLLEVMIDDDQPVTEEDRRRFHEGQAWFAERGGHGIPMEDMLAECEFKADDFPLKR